MAEFWGRYTSVSIDPPTDVGDRPLSRVEFTSDELDVFFEVFSVGEVEEGKRQEEDVETYIELRVYNISNTTYSAIGTRQVVISSKDDEEIILEHGSNVIVDSGYIDNTSNVFTGEVVDKVRIRDGGDIYTKLTCVNALDVLRRTKVNKTLFFSKVSETVRYLIGLAGVPEGYIEDTGTEYIGTRLGRWLIFSSTVYDELYLQSTRTPDRMYFGIRNNEFYWESNANSPEKDNVYDLNAETGLVKLEKMSGANVNVVFLVTTLMIPKISKGSRVRLSDPDTGNFLTCRVIYEPTHSSTRLTHISELQVVVETE